MLHRVSAPRDLMAELFRLESGIEAIHVPYRGGGPAMTDLLGGQVDYMIENVPQLLPQVSARALRALAATSAARLSSAPEVPTFSESGIPGLEVGTWFGLLGPRDLPQNAIDTLVQAIKQGVCTENPIRVDDGMESPQLAE
jgi:tripartite-type tricarboxylate transporter receptor subunit TctC